MADYERKSDIKAKLDSLPNNEEGINEKVMEIESQMQGITVNDRDSLNRVKAIARELEDATKKLLKAQKVSGEKQAEIE